MTVISNLTGKPQNQKSAGQKRKLTEGQSKQNDKGRQTHFRPPAVVAARQQMRKRVLQ
jgi:hypothetical protein